MRGFQTGENTPNRRKRTKGGVSEEERRRRLYVDQQGRATNVLPSQSRGLATIPQPVAAAPQPMAAPTQAPPTMAPGVGPQGANWQARAEQKHRVMRDTAGFQAARAEQDKKFAGTQQEIDAKRQEFDQRGKQSSRLDKVRNGINRVGPISAGLIAAPAVAEAFDPNSTARYAERFGVNEPTGDGSAGDVAKYAALRGLGFASDVGSTMTAGIADKFYRDKQEVDTETMGATAGGVAGGYGGNKLGKYAGKGVDALLTGASRGRYKKDWGEKFLGGAGMVGGAIGGANIGRGFAAGDEEVPQQDSEGIFPESSEYSPQVLDNNITREGNSFSGQNIGAGYTVNGRPSAETDPLVYHSENPGEDGANNFRAKRQLFANTPEWDGGNQGIPGAGGGGGQQQLGGFQAGGGGGGPTARLIRKSGMPSNAEIMRERMRGQREQTEQQGRQVEGGLALKGQELGFNQRLQSARMAAEQAQNAPAMRAAQRMESLQMAYQQAETDEERASIAQQLRDMQGQARPPHQIAKVDELSDPGDPMSQVLSKSYVVDPTGGARAVAGEGGPKPIPTQYNIKALRTYGKNNPELIAQFDREFGEGAAARYGVQ